MILRCWPRTLPLMALSSPEPFKRLSDLVTRKFLASQSPSARHSDATPRSRPNGQRLYAALGWRTHRPLSARSPKVSSPSWNRFFGLSQQARSSTNTGPRVVPGHEDSSGNWSIPSRRLPPILSTTSSPNLAWLSHLREGHQTNGVPPPAGCHQNYRQPTTQT